MRLSATEKFLFSFTRTNESRWGKNVCIAIIKQNIRLQNCIAFLAPQPISFHEHGMCFKREWNRNVVFT